MKSMNYKNFIYSTRIYFGQYMTGKNGDTDFLLSVLHKMHIIKSVGVHNKILDSFHTRSGHT